MAYNRTNWQNGSSPYINELNLNKIEKQHVLVDNILGTSNIVQYSSSLTYNKGDYRIYNDIVYIANQAISTPEEFNSSHWDKVILLGGGSSDGVPIGTGHDYFGTTAPENYMFADGSAISRATYSELFAIIGTTYGEGDGSTTFNLPDKRQRVSVMYKENSSMGTTDALFGTLGAKGGEDKHTLTVDELATHKHTFSGRGGYGSSTTYNASTAEVATQTSSGTFNTENSGNNQPHNNLQPYIVCNYIIKVK